MLKSNDHKDYIDVNKQTMSQKMRKKLIEVEQRFTKLHLPYCARAAKMDYERMLEDYARNIQSKEGYAQEEDFRLPKFDFEKYGDSKRFDLIKEEDSVDKVLVGIERVSKKTGVNMFYVDKQTGSRVTVNVPTQVYEQRKKTKPTPPAPPAPSPPANPQGGEGQSQSSDAPVVGR